MKEAVIGLVGIVLGAFAADWFGQQTSRRLERNEFVAMLNLVRTELCFFRDKLLSLEGWIQEELVKLSRSRNPTIQYYGHDIYPDVLSECKVALAGFDRCPKLVLLVTECHYDLCCLKVEINRMQAAIFEEKPHTRDGWHMESHLNKLHSFVRATRQKCETALPEIDSQVQAARSESFGLAKLFNPPGQVQG